MKNYIIKLKLFYVFIIVTIGFSITTEDIYDNSWALVIGIDKYQNVKKLNYAVDDDSDFRFLLNIGYDINDLMNENNENLLDGLAIGFGFQVVGVD